MNLERYECLECGTPLDTLCGCGCPDAIHVERQAVVRKRVLLLCDLPEFASRFAQELTREYDRLCPSDIVGVLGTDISAAVQNSYSGRNRITTVETRQIDVATGKVYSRRQRQFCANLVSARLADYGLTL